MITWLITLIFWLTPVGFKLICCFCPKEFILVLKASIFSPLWDHYYRDLKSSLANLWRVGPSFPFSTKVIIIQLYTLSQSHWLLDWASECHYLALPLASSFYTWACATQDQHYNFTWSIHIECPVQTMEYTAYGTSWTCQPDRTP